MFTGLRWDPSGKLKRYYVYIISDLSMSLYIGVTNDLAGRTWKHMNRVGGRFTSRYHFDRLVYFEIFGDPEAAIARETQLKGWNREKKMNLIRATNPEWKDLTPPSF